MYFYHVFFFNLEIAQQRKVAIVRLIAIFVDYFELLFVHFLRYVKNNIFTVRYGGIKKYVYTRCFWTWTFHPGTLRYGTVVIIKMIYFKILCSLP